MLKYRYFQVNEGKVIGFIESTRKMEANDLIPVTKENEHLFMKCEVNLIVKDGKIVEDIKSNEQPS